MLQKMLFASHSQTQRWKAIANGFGILVRSLLIAQVIFGGLALGTFLAATGAGRHATPSKQQMYTIETVHVPAMALQHAYATPMTLSRQALGKRPTKLSDTRMQQVHDVEFGKVKLGNRPPIGASPHSSESLILVATSMVAIAAFAFRKWRRYPQVSMFSNVGEKQVDIVDTIPGAASDIKVLSSRFFEIASPFWSKETNPDARAAQVKLAGIIALSLLGTGVSVYFSFLGRDFFNYLTEKNVDAFWSQLRLYAVVIPVALPVFVMRDFFSSQLKLEWRQWMAKDMMDKYMDGRSYYRVQTESLLDNPDQRITSDVNQFTSTSLGFFFTIFNSITDLISFSGILYSIYPPLFVVLIVYSFGGTLISIKLGEPLVGLNFEQEKKEANFRYSLVRIRENTESIAFYGGERNELATLKALLDNAVDNLLNLLVTSRNLGFFQSYYQFFISLLPAAVIAPLYFQGLVEYGIINQSSSAFNHILGDLSLVVTEFGALAGFAAVIDRLGEFTEILQANSDRPAASAEETPAIAPPGINMSNGLSDTTLLKVDGLDITTPNGARKLLENLNFSIQGGESLLVMGPSGSGKTSLLRALAGLWTNGSGNIFRAANPDRLYQDLFFLPQKPYMVLGTLRDQLLYPTWQDAQVVESNDEAGDPGTETNSKTSSDIPEFPTDDDLVKVLNKVRLDSLLSRGFSLDSVCDWSSTLSLGEQQRLSFARLLLAKPRLAILDECTSALDLENEGYLYRKIQEASITCISVGHRPSLQPYHARLLVLEPDADGGPSKMVFATLEQANPMR